MNEKQKTLSELQEIIFWQQLNKQIIELKSQGNPLSEKQQKAFQQFSFDERLFSKVTSPPLIDEISLALLTDFADICFVNKLYETWNTHLTQLIPNTCTLNIEEALANAFDALSYYTDRYDLLEKTPNGEHNEDDDEELYDFIDEYQSIRDSQGIFFDDLVSKSYALKSSALTKIMEEHDWSRFLVVNENGLLFDYTNFPNRDIVSSIYKDTFCNPAKSIIAPQGPGKRIFDSWDLPQFLLENKDQPGLKPSIMNFITYELNLLDIEAILIRRFFNDLTNWRKGAFEICICNTSSFSFLDDPLPLV